MTLEPDAVAQAEREALRQLLPYAALAPSKLNAQPWRFRVTRDRLEIVADRTRATPASDPYDRQLTLACGSALMNARVAARAQGRLPSWSLEPQDDPDVVGTLRLGESRPPSAADRALFEAISTRRTYRNAFQQRDVSESILEELSQAASAEGAWLHIARGAERDLVATLVYEGDRLLWSHPAWRRELAAWMHPRRVGDGIPLPDGAVDAAVRLVRTFDMGGGEAARHEDLARCSPVIAIVGTDREDAQSWMQAGQAIQRLLLVAQTLGVQASYLNQPVEVPAMRWRLAEEVGRKGYPHVVLRLGHPLAAVPPSPRRDLWTMVDEA